MLPSTRAPIDILHTHLLKMQSFHKQILNIQGYIDAAVKRHAAATPPYLGLSLEILATMIFPDDSERQNAFYTAFAMSYPTPVEKARQPINGPDRKSAGKFFLDLMNADIAASQSRWQNTGDQLVLLLRMIATDEISKEEASLSKARHLLETTRCAESTETRG